MNKGMTLLIILIAFLSCNENETISYKSDKGFSFSYSDEEWSIEDTEDILLLFSNTIKGPDFRTNINILVQDLSSQPMSLQDYHILTLQQIVQALGEDTLQNEKDIKVSGLPAKEIVYKIPQDIDRGNYLELKIKQVYLIKDNKAYLITYTSKPKDFNAFLEAANMVFETFKLD
ncbi:MAG: hypothetical protein GX163_11190 [Bacteroidetes bacterium]|nr:hypothetical protein [Bacteroidota bacterium]